MEERHRRRQRRALAGALRHPSGSELSGAAPSRFAARIERGKGEEKRGEEGWALVVVVARGTA